MQFIQENDEKTGESLTTTVLDDLTKVYEELDGGVNELQDNQVKVGRLLIFIFTFYIISHLF